MKKALCVLAAAFIMWFFVIHGVAAILTRETTAPPHGTYTFKGLDAVNLGAFQVVGGAILLGAVWWVGWKLDDID